jgi:hypothetical protein
MPEIDDLEVIRELLTGTLPSQDVNDHVKGRLTAIIAAESHPGAGLPVRRGPRPRRTVAGLVAAGVALATAAAAISVAVVVPGTSRPEVSGGRPAVIQLLAKIATAASHQPVPRVRDSQFEYVKSWGAGYVLSRAAAPGSGQVSWHIHRTRPIERQIWLSVSDLCRPGLLRQGATTVRMALPVAPRPQSDKPPYRPATSHPGTRCPDRGSLGAPTYRLLQSLPTNPAALLHRIHAFDNTQAAHPLQGAQASAAAFWTISELVGESIVPPAVGAALYRAAALIPEIQRVPNAVDALGRHGVGVTLRAGATWGPTEMIFDRTTLQLIGTFTSPPPVSWAGQTTPPHGRALPPAFTAIQSRAFVNHPGQFPRQ